MGFHNGNAKDGKHYWLTPPELLRNMRSEFGPLDFDPCPYPVPEGFDGLTCDWGQSNYVNPPFGSIIHDGKKKGPTAWARKEIIEADKGKDVVFVYPLDKWVLMLIERADRIKNLRDVSWLSIEDKAAVKDTGRHIALFYLKGK